MANARLEKLRNRRVEHRPATLGGAQLLLKPLRNDVPAPAGEFQDGGALCLKRNPFFSLPRRGDAYVCEI